MWLFHGYFYLVYVITVAMLGVKLRWPLLRFVLVMAAGTIPTHVVRRRARRDPSARTAADRAGAEPAAVAETPDGPSAGRTVPAAFAAVPPNAVTRSARARATRERIVPTGQPTTSAASA